MQITIFAATLVDRIDSQADCHPFVGPMGTPYLQIRKWFEDRIYDVPPDGKAPGTDKADLMKELDDELENLRDKMVGNGPSGIPSDFASIEYETEDGAYMIMVKAEKVEV